MLRFKKAMRRSQDSQPPAKKMENTFQVEPRIEQRFDVSSAREKMEDEMNRALAAYTYSAHSAPRIAQSLSKRLTRVVREAGQWRRHRVVVHVVVAERRQQDVRATSRCLWNACTDSHVSATHSGDGFTASATAYAVYLD
jgi:hypothetical protein